MKVRVACVLAFCLAGNAADAQVVQRYTYDANGRLIGATSSVYGSGVGTTYTYDDANNRTSRTRTSGAYARLADDDDRVEMAEASTPSAKPPSEAAPPRTPASSAPTPSESRTTAAGGASQ